MRRPHKVCPVDYVLTALRAGAMRAQSIAAAADTIGIGLRAGLISSEAALLWARDAGVLDLIGQEDIEDAAALELQGAAP